jgi:seryl-tRNA synthetase
MKISQFSIMLMGLVCASGLVSAVVTPDQAKRSASQRRGMARRTTTARNVPAESRNYVSDRPSINPSQAKQSQSELDTLQREQSQMIQKLNQLRSTDKFIKSDETVLAEVQSLELRINELTQRIVQVAQQA